MTDRTAGAGPPGWVRAALAVACLVLLVAAYPVAPWAPNRPAPDEVVGVASSRQDDRDGARLISDGVVVVVPAGSAGALGAIRRSARQVDEASPVVFRIHANDFRFLITRGRFDRLGGRIARIEDGTFSLRPITPGRYLMCFLSEAPAVQQRVFATRCTLQTLHVPGTAELSHLPAIHELSVQSRPLGWYP